MKAFFQKIVSELTSKLSIHAILASTSITLWTLYFAFGRSIWSAIIALLCTLLFLFNYIAQNYSEWKKQYYNKKLERRFNNKKWRDKRYQQLTDIQKDILALLYIKRDGVLLQLENTDIRILTDSLLIRHAQNGVLDQTFILGSGGGVKFQFFIQPVAEIIVQEHIEEFQKHINNIKKKSYFE